MGLFTPVSLKPVVGITLILSAVGDMQFAMSHAPTPLLKDEKKPAGLALCGRKQPQGGRGIEEWKQC
jgi:hypothetical protein